MEKLALKLVEWILKHYDYHYAYGKFDGDVNIYFENVGSVPVEIPVDVEVQNINPIEE